MQKRKLFRTFILKRERIADELKEIFIVRPFRRNAFYSVIINVRIQGQYNMANTSEFAKRRRLYTFVKPYFSTVVNESLKM